ncbi:MAG: gliding motility-associated C-terminal domain-containing protein [Chitinophagales bacterium]|nr:gliding motility-associated C-terminal domain-containing protein [Chitinophagales bacterium]
MLLLISISSAYAQTYIDGPIQLQVRVRDWRVNYNATDAGTLGVGFAPDELTFKIWAEDNANVSGIGWQGGACLTQNFNPPGLSQDFNYTMYNYTYPTNSVPQFVSLRIDAWEDDIDSDALLGFCSNGNRCDYDGGRCCGLPVFGVCVGLNESDDRRCDANPFLTTLDYRLGDPCAWYNHGYVTGSCTEYQPRIETYWRYTRGTSCNNAISLGTMASGSSILHYNSNVCYSNQWPNSNGNDVFYSFNINGPLGINANVCGPNGAQFDSYLYILDQNCQVRASNDNGCGSQSNISTFLCQPGTYYIVVDAVTANDLGTFTLSLTEDTNFTFVTTINKQDVQCFGNNDGTAKAVVTGGVSPYTFLWSTGATSDSIGALPPGPVSVTVTDFYGCSTVASTNINEPPLLTANVTSTPVSCSGYRDGTAIVLPTGGTPPYRFFWNGIPPQVTQSAIALPAGSITVNLIDDNNCIYIDSVVVGTNTVITNTLDNLSNVSCFGAADGSINITINGGQTPYTYNWSHGATTEDVSNLSPGTYNLTVYDADSCNVESSYTITEPPLLTISIDDTANVTCFGGSNGSVTVLVNGGTPSYSYQWSNGSQSQNLLNVPAGPYTNTVTDQNGCTATASHTINEPAELLASFSPTNPACFGDSTGSIDITVTGGTQPYSFLWTNSATSEDIASLPAGTYGVLVTDSNNCFFFDFESLSTNPELQVSVVSVTNVNCNGASTGAIVLNTSGGAAGGYTYNWSNPAASGSSPTTLPAGNYSVTVTDLNGCADSVSTSITETAAMSINLVSSNNLRCNGDNSGNININTSGGTSPYNYIWNDGNTGEDRLNIPAGTYSITATDVNGCTVQNNGITITEPAVLQNSMQNPVNPSCFGVNDGSVGALVSGGTFPYRYLWSNGATGSFISGLGGGTYSLLATDANNCQVFDTITLTPASAVTISGQVTDLLCNGARTGEIVLTVNGGTLPYNYLWTPSVGNTATVSNLAAGWYTVNVTDNNGCLATDSFEVNEPPALQLSLLTTPVRCYGDADGLASPLLNGGTPNYTYLWSDGQTTDVATGLNPGTMTLTVTDANNCSVSAQAVVQGPVLLELGIDTLIPNPCYGDSSASIDLDAKGGVPPYQYAIENNNFQSSGNFTGLASGNYTAVLIDSNECIATRAFTINSPNDWTVTFAEPYVFISRGADVELQPIIDSNLLIAVYGWSPSDGLNCIDCRNPKASPLETTTYTITAIDQNGCARSEQVAVVVKNGYEIFYPTAFSPGVSIGFNDVWVPIDFGAAKEITVQIYDRWGSKVYETNDLSKGWDGTYKGQLVSPDTYVYIVDGKYRDDTPFSARGSFHVVR